MLDVNQIREELKAMRGKESMKAFAKRIGIDWGKVQRFEKGAQSIWIEDMAAWLEGSNSSLVEFFTQRATADKLAELAKDKELADKVRRALVLPKKREALIAALRLVFPDER